jgi:NADPH-dependent 2,4-dienoyl-CoA reductase/sulfur reductase-like enzyme
LPEGVKKVVKIPVIACTRINDPIMSDEILTSGKADIIGMGRPLLADPELPNKAKKGRFEDIRTCIACCYCMDRPHADMRNVLNNLPVLCSINAQCGREGIYAIERASKPKRIAVVGGGPAGLEAARVAALRGHRVTLYEKDNKLGGLLNIAKIPPHKEELVGLIDHLVRQAEDNGVRIKLGEEFTEATLERDKAEAVILATGSVPLVPEISGVENSNVVGFADVLTDAREVGDRVVIVGGGMVGCETAEFLHAKGKQVTILEMLPRIGDDIGVTNRFAIMGRLREAGIRMLANTKAARITEKGVEATRDGATELFEGDTVVLATGMKAKNELAKNLEHKVGVLYSIGDCAEPQRIVEAIENGFRIAAQI